MYDKYDWIKKYPEEINGFHKKKQEEERANDKDLQGTTVFVYIVDKDKKDNNIHRTIYLR